MLSAVWSLSTMSLLLSLSSPSPLLPGASAFCGAYVNGGGAPLTNRSSVIAIARQAGMTTLSMRNDFRGELTDFGLVIPIPAAVQQEDVRVIDTALFDKLDGYTGPRLAEYTCDDWYGVSEAALAADTGAGFQSGGCSLSLAVPKEADFDSGGVPDSGVIIEDQFDLAEYEVWILSAAGAEGLAGWLSANGFVVPEGSQAIFDEYIEQGVRFVALKIDPTRVTDPAWLSPLQFSYADEGFQLPIRMGTTASEGVQDLVVYTLTDPESGRVGISNYPEATPPVDECMLEDDGTFSHWYDVALAEALGLPSDPDQLNGASGLSWITEYGWGSGLCDPCTSVGPLSAEEVARFGFDAHYGFYVTRLHLRYTPDAVTQDLTFYETRQTDNTQQRYIAHKWELEGALPLCSGEIPEDAGTCYSSEYWLRRATGEISDPVRSPSGGCGGGAALLLLPGALLLRRRR